MVLSSTPSQLSGAAGVVSCVGAFGSDEKMEKICGDATVTATEAAKKVSNELAKSCKTFVLPAGEGGLSGLYQTGPPLQSLESPLPPASVNKKAHTSRSQACTSM